MSVDPERLRELFFGALEKPAEARDAYLDDECGGDAALVAELRSLLAHHDDAPLIHADNGQLVLAAVLDEARKPTSRVPPETSEPRYRTLGELGAGGFGLVVQRFDRSLRRIVASKSPSPAGAVQRAAILREARLLAYLDHPGVVQVYDLREGDAEVSYTMELLDGECLSKRLADLRAQERPMAISEAVRIVSRVCETVASAHARGVVHLDLKPDNVMLQPFGQVSVIDWGMARFFDPAPYREHLARAGEGETFDLEGDQVSGGTPAYMPPEQFDPMAKLGPSADLYAMGSLFFELLTGRAPFEGHDSLADLQAQKRRGAPAVRELRPEVSERLGALCGAMLAPRREDRPLSLSVVLADLASLTDVCGGAERLHLEPGEVLFEQGAESNTAYQILSGELEILVAGKTVATRGIGDIVGELAILSRARRSATVRAKLAAQVRALDWAAFEDELKKVDPFVGHLLRSLSDKLIESTGGR